MKEWRQVATPEPPIRYKLEEIPSHLQPVVTHFEDEIAGYREVMDDLETHTKNQVPGGPEWNRGMGEIFSQGKDFRERRGILRALVGGDTASAASFLRHELTRINRTIAELEEDASQYPKQFNFPEMIENSRAEKLKIEALLAACETGQ